MLLPSPPENFYNAYQSCIQCVQLGLLSTLEHENWEMAVTITRLDLAAAPALAQLADSLLRAQVRNVEVFYLVDWIIVLRWIRVQRTWRPYIQHRVNGIRSISKAASWKVFPGSFNLTYLPSRGISSECVEIFGVRPSGSLEPNSLSKRKRDWSKCLANNLYESDDTEKEAVKPPMDVVQSLATNEVQQQAVAEIGKVLILVVVVYTTYIYLGSTLSRFVNVGEKKSRWEFNHQALLSPTHSLPQLQRTFPCEDRLDKPSPHTPFLRVTRSFGLLRVRRTNITNSFWAYSTIKCSSLSQGNPIRQQIQHEEACPLF